MSDLRMPDPADEPTRMRADEPTDQTTLGLADAPVREPADAPVDERTDEPGGEPADAPAGGAVACALPPIEELLARAHVVALPLATRFRGVVEREAVLFEGACRLPDGTTVWSEFSPFTEYGTAESSAWLAAAIEYGFDPHLERATTGHIEVNATVPAVPASEVANVLARYDGCRTVKVKVAERGQTLADDLARLEAVRDALPHARLRIDANAGWTVTEAVQALRAITAAGIELEYAEQPVPGITGLAEVRRQVPDVRIAADEAVRKADDPLAVARAGAADHVIVKAQPLGGVRRAAEVVAASGLTATVSSALDTSVGIVMGAQLAARLPEPRYAAGLGTVSLFAADVVSEPRRPLAGRIALAPAVPDPALLREHAASGARRDWWLDRIRACHAHLAHTHGGAAL